MPPAPPRRRPLAGLAFGALLAALLAEGAARLLWADPPDHLSPIELQVRHPDGSGAVIGRGRYERYRINAAGYRGPPLRPPGAAALRVAVLGDSFVYGVGVSEDEALPGRLGAALAARGLDAEVLNGGVPGANLERGLGRVGEALTRHRPDLVLFVLLWNDLDLAGPEARYGAGLDGSRFTGRGTETAVGRVAQALLPVPPSPAPGAPPVTTVSAPVEARYRLARASRAYAFLALWARARGTHWGQIDRELTLLHTDTPAVRAAAWGRLTARVSATAAAARAAGVPFGLVHFMDGPLAGLPAERLREALDATGVPVLDLSPRWGDHATYTARHTLGWDSHPNRAALADAGEAIAAWIAASGWTGAPPTPADTAAAAAQATAAAAWRAAQAPLAAAQRAQIDALTATFRSEVGSSDPRTPPPATDTNQWLLGWEAPPAGDPRRALRGEGTVWLRVPPAGAAALEVEAEAPRAGGATLEAACAEGPAGPRAALPPGGTARLRFPFGAPLVGGSLVECRLQLHGLAGPHGGAVMVRRVALVPAG